MSSAELFANIVLGLTLLGAVAAFFAVRRANRRMRGYEQHIEATERLLRQLEREDAKTRQGDP